MVKRPYEEVCDMKQRTLPKSELTSLLLEMRRTRRVFAPADEADGPEFREISDDTELVTDYQNLRLSPKGLFFPQTETMYSYDYDTIEDIPEPEDRILVYGARPCDSRSLTLLDKIFSTANKGYDDPYYMKRRRGSIVISVACSEPCGTCFCSSVGGGPADPQGSDVLVHEVDDVLVFDPQTERGDELLEEHAERFSDADEAAVTAAENSAQRAEGMMTDLGIDRDRLKAALDEGFESAKWVELTRNCIACGACTYLCPTCYCFDIADEERLYKGRRIRTWDSCQYPKFTAHASGHNPRNTKLERLRQRFMHKFSYTVENNGEIFCVGCGRCIVHCPVNLDIREIISAFSAETVGS